METVNNNSRLIAEFLGAKSKHDIFAMHGIIKSIDNTIYVQHYFQPSEMPFNTDWNWIMEVVTKIRKLRTPINDSRLMDPIATYEFNMYDTIIRIVKQGGATEDIIDVKIGDNLITAVYTACVKFIQYYNRNEL